jgi:hypothetical protein
MDKVWVVTSGQYSDYGIDCIFDSKEKADTYVEFQRKYDRYTDVNEPFEMTLNKPDEQKVVYVVKINFSGEEIERYTLLQPTTYDNEYATDWQGEVTSFSSRGYDVALKIARDELMMLKAQREGLT